MSVRICPKCSEKLNDHNNYYCPSCGEKLPDDLVVAPVPIKVREFSSLQPLFSLKKKKDIQADSEEPTEEDEEDNNKEERKEEEHIVSIRDQKNMAFKRKMLIMLFGVIAFGLGLFALVHVFVNFFNLEDPVTVEEKTYSSTIKLGLDLEESEFGDSGLIEYVPYDALVYIEGNDLHGLFKEYLSAGQLKIPDELFFKVSELFEKKFVAFSSVYNGKPEWYVVLTPKDAQKVENAIKDLNHDYLRFKLINGDLVISTHGDSFGLVEAPISGTELNFALNPQYARSKAKLAPSGQVLIIFGSDEEGRAVLNAVSTQNAGGDLAKILNDITSEMNLSELVISR